MCITLFSTSVSYSAVVLLIRQMVLPLSQPSVAPRIQKLLSCRMGHTYSNYIAMETLISDTFILPAFLVPSMYNCVCFLIEGEKKSKKILEYSYKLSISRRCVFS